MKKDLFDLDLKINKDTNNARQEIKSKALCTPGTCNCDDGPTLASACCSVELTIYHCTK